MGVNSTRSYPYTRKQLVLTANQFIPLWDTTRDTAQWTAAAALTTAAGGRQKGQECGGRAIGHIYCTAQNLTLGFKYLRADGSWDDAAAKPTQTVTAGTALPFSWLYSDYSADFMIYIQAGATPPTAIYYEMSIVWDRAAGVS
jgi:hypothetical protein